METIKILGSGCAKCKQTYNVVKEVLEENNIHISIEKIEDFEEIMKYDVLSTPAVAINQSVKISGRVPTKEEILNLIK